MLDGMDDVRQRLKEALDSRGIDYAVASRRCGKNHAYIQQYLRRGTPRRLPDDVRECLADLLGMPEDDLRPPRGDQPNGATEAPPPISSIQPRYRGRIPGSQPEITGAAGAGPGEMPEDRVIMLSRGEAVLGHAVKAEWVLPPDYLRQELNASPGATWVFRVTGDSMEPSLARGDRVLIDTSHSVAADDGIYVIDEGNGPLVKRVHLIRRSDPPEYEIISDNQIVPSYRMPADEIRIIGRVCGRVSRM